MLQVPTRALITSGSARGTTELNAFDNALVKAGIGNLNLLQVSSVLPPGAPVLGLSESHIDIPSGSIIPAVFRKVVTSGNATAACALAVGMPASAEDHGMVFETAAFAGAVSAEKQAKKMVEEALRVRCIKIGRIILTSAETETCPDGLYSCAVSAVLLLP